MSTAICELEGVLDETLTGKRRPMSLEDLRGVIVAFRRQNFLIGGSWLGWAEENE